MAAFVLTTLAMLAFAGNSILCRLALAQGSIDAASFTMVRTAAGAVALMLLVLPRHGVRRPRLRDWQSATMLFAYMACFSFAYVTLSAGSGALILFGAVQISMILYAVRKGERLTLWSWTGFALAVAGLIWLVSPGLTAPEPVGAILMAGAGIAWGIYSLLGRSVGNPIQSTASNFMLATPMAALLMLVSIGSAELNWQGATLAIASGAITSGLGYVIWYAVLPGLTAARAASVQLTVPVFAAILGVILLSESFGTRLVLASVAVLGGVGIVVSQRALK